MKPIPQRAWITVAFLTIGLTVASAAGAQSWIELLPTGGPPDGRAWHSTGYNPIANRMIVFGGSNSPQFTYVPPDIALRNDVWVLSNADGSEASTPSWTQLLPSGTPPSKRGYAAAAYDPMSNRMTLFGGNPAIGFCNMDVNDVWLLTNADGTEASSPTWTQLFPTGGPPSPRAGHSAVYDPGSNRMIVFAGSNECSPSNNEVWVLENANGLGGTPNWIPLSPTGTPPLPRRGHGAVYDPANNRMIVFGPVPPVGPNEVWVLENASGLGGMPNWVQLSPSGGPPGESYSGEPSIAYDALRNEILIFGGCCLPVPDPIEGARWGDTWLLENANGLGGAPNWVELVPAPDPVSGEPLARDAHGAVFREATRRMTLFGGRACNSPGGSGPPFCDTGPEHDTMTDVWVLERAPTCQDLRDLGATIRSADLGEFVYRAYRVIMGYMADAAARNCDLEDWRDTVTLLDRIIERTDGIVPPSDWMMPGGPRDAIHDTAVGLRDFFAGLLP